jgi:L-asparaginase II
MHIDRIEALLRRGGLSSGISLPTRPAGRGRGARRVLRAGGSASRIFMNCSGKHTGMLLTCQAAGWSLPDYLAVDHPLQRACREAVADVAGEPVAATASHGCGAPVLAISLTALARPFSGWSPPRPVRPKGTVADAMRANPELCSGTGADDARLMGAVPGLLSKVGAEGVVAVAVPGLGAVAIKIDDGASRARMPVLMSALGRLGLSTSVLDEIAQVRLLGGGQPVGAIHSLL